MKVKIILRLCMVASVLAAGFYVGYGGVAKAWPTPYHIGYFTGANDSAGVEIFSPGSGTPGCASAGGYAVPYTVVDTGPFINYIKCKLTSTNANSVIRTQEKTGAAFIIQTMIGDTGSKITSLSDSRVADWENRVNYYSSKGWINFAIDYSYTYNTYFQGTYSSASPNDDAFYGNSGTALAIVFNNGSSVYAIRRACANPVGNTYVPLSNPWDAVGRTTVSDGVSDPGDTSTAISTRPGDTLTFNHYIKNNGPGVAPQSYALFGHDNMPDQWTGRYYNNTTISGTPVLTTTEGTSGVDGTTLNNNWGTGSPGGGVNADNFSARWTRTSYYTEGTYTFFTTTDDGSNLYVDGIRVLNDWVSHAATSYYTTVNLTAGMHTVRFDYFELGGDAVAILRIWNQLTNLAAYGNIGSGAEPLITSQTVSVPVTATSGTKICRRIYWDWKNSSASGDFPYGSAGMGDPACATVVSDYDLKPVVTASATTAQDGDSVTFTYTIQNDGTANSPPAQCYNKDGGGAAIGTSFTCSTSQTFSGGGTPVTVGTETITISNQSPGTTICRILYVEPAAAGTPSRASTPTCVVIAKTPYVRFMGNDVWAGGGFASINPSCNTAAKIMTSGRALGGTSPTQYAGSVTEYMAFALDQVSAFGSSSKPLVGFGSLGSAPRSLTFGNFESTLSLLGYFGAPQHCITDVSSNYASAACCFPSFATEGDYTRHNVGDITSGGTVYPGRKVYYVEGNFTVSSDIVYNGYTAGVSYPNSYPSVDRIPGLVIIVSGNIYVQPGVNRMDGTYITKGTFYTCWPKTEPASVSVCNQPLTINGAVLANRLDLHRTYGADGNTVPSRQAAAETFNFSPEVYLTNALSSTNADSVYTTNVIELPPRF